jgi:hypothetical protein
MNKSLVNFRLGAEMESLALTTGEEFHTVTFYKFWL